MKVLPRYNYIRHHGYGHTIMCNQIFQLEGLLQIKNWHYHFRLTTPPLPEAEARAVEAGGVATTAEVLAEEKTS